MAHRDLAGGLQSALERVECACATLCSPGPSGMESCRAALEAAAADVTALAGVAPAPETLGAALASALALRATVGRARALLDSAAEYHLSWNRTLGGLLQTYTPEGRPAPPSGPARICLQG